jgi:hypothetical protein
MVTTRQQQAKRRFIGGMALSLFIGVVLIVLGAALGYPAVVAVGVVDLVFDVAALAFISGKIRAARRGA